LTVGCRRAVDQIQDFHGAYSLRSTSGYPSPFAREHEIYGVLKIWAFAETAQGRDALAPAE
jgi:hypothetical protein